MADLAGTYYLRTPGTSEQPTIQYKVTYTSTRTGVNTVKTNVKVTLLKMSSGSYFGYNVTGYAVIGGKTGSTVTIKGNLPNTWSNITVDLGTFTNTGVDAKATTLAARVYMNSNAANRKSDTGARTVSFPIGNTNAYWTSSKYCTVSPSGIIPENTSTLSVSWGGAKDDQGDTIYYNTQFFANGSSKGYLSGSPTTGRTGSVNVSSYGQGSTFYFKTHCRDKYNSDPGVFGVQSGTVTKNTLTAASLTGSGSITFDTNSFNLTRSNASNKNGNTSFTYTLECTDSGVTLYNGNVSSLGTSIPVSVYRTGTVPTGPYLRFSEIQSHFASSNYKGSLTFRLSTKNAYNTTKSTTRAVSVNLQKEPAAPSGLTASGAYPIQGQNYFVVNRRGVTHTWGACTEPNGTAPIYDVELSIDGGAWTSYAVGLSAPSYTTPLMNRNREGTLKARVRSRTVYGTTSPWVEGDELAVHYYEPPVLSGLSVERAEASQTTTGSIKKNSSISGISYGLTIAYKNGSTILATQNPVMTDSHELSYTQENLSESDTFTETVTVSDNVSSIFGIASPQSTGTLIIPRYAAILTIREKGVGVNAVAGDYADLIAKGTMSFYGGDNEAPADGSINLGTQLLSNTNIYCGLYRDATGNLRAAQNLGAGQEVYQLQTYYSTPLAKPPLCWRKLSSSTATPKDAVFTPTTEGEWKYLMDEDFNGANLSKVAGDLKTYMTPDFIGAVDNSFRGKILWSGSWTSGNIIVPGLDKYNVFQVTMDGQGTSIVALKTKPGTTTVYLRGWGGYSSVTPTISTYHFAATVSGNTLTYVACNSFGHKPSSTHGEISDRVVTKIIGIV